MLKKLCKWKNTGLVWLLLSVIVMLLDRCSKMWALQHLVFAEPVKVFPFLNFTLAFNTGAAFSFLNQASGWQHYFLGGLAVVTVAIISVWLARTPRNHYWQNLSLSLIAAGALGNVWDRLLYGHVVDFIAFHLGDWHFAIFNVADSAISVGACLLILKWLVQGVHEPSGK